LTLESTIRVRQFAPRDIGRIKVIEQASMRHLTPFSSLALHYEIVPEGFLVAEVDGEVVGYIITNLRKTQKGNEVGHILAVAVDPAYRRRKVGTALMEQITGVFKGKGVDQLCLEVKASNREARNFHLNLGFKEICVVKRYYRMRGYTEDAVMMVKKIK